ncbi:hypothetical protein M0C34_14590 [Agarivorans sp. TSD2052]|uniref:hypothetical protein n=1 Tax=Agarivorans sp. TSD2052 TaxID=2937286 RepID=UPI00200D2C88|nr:hypothetical protein [Agarivorans sp. TSD2052]UPW17457.1 hypothetical protein M0C34_14590 [Agarivorans sp. TSD2052]
MFLKNGLLSVLLAFISSSVFALPQVSAEYSRTAKQGFERSTSRFTFTRAADHVMTVYPQKNTAEMWQKRNNGRHHFYRFFTADQRTVYYPASDLSSLNINRSWQSIEQLVPVKWLAALNKVDSRQQDGQTIEYYQGKMGDTYIELEWLPEYQLPQRLLTKQGYKSLEMKLESINQGSHEIEQQLDKWMKYPSIDYADVGDSESDPFLAKMIRQGFIEHGASGVYDANGNQIHANHAH